MSDDQYPLVTVVTASFNALDGLRKTVDSVASQSFRSVEHVVIDGGSTDGTPEYLQNLNDQIRWISEPDDGIASAMNKGIAMARGTYVVVLQAEDEFCGSDSLRAASAHLSNGSDIVAFEVWQQKPDGSRTRRKSRPFGLLTYLKMTSPHQGMFVRRDLYQRIGSFDPQFRIAMDYEFLLRAKSEGAKLTALNEVITTMPATGVSTKTDWCSVRQRLAEDRRLQSSYINGWLGLAMHRLFWAAYMPFKRVKVLLASEHEA